MKDFFKKASSSGVFLKTESGMSRQGLMMILLVIIAGVGGVFYFTDLIKPGSGTGAPDSNQLLVKKPMPPRPGINVAVNDGKPASEHQEATSLPEHTASAEKSEPSMKSGEKKPSPPQQSATKQNTAKSESAKPSNGHAAKLIPTKPATTARSDKAVISAKGTEKNAKKKEESEQDKTSSKDETKPEKGSYTLLAGVYVMEKSMLAEKAKLKSAGLVPVVMKGPKKEEPMNRLFMGEFDSYPEASLEMKKIKKITGDAFILPEKGKFSLYAGSYFVKERAEKERDRLIKAGLKPVVRMSTVPVTTYRLTAGSYQSSKPAETEAGRLKKLGVKVSVVKSGT